MPRDLDDPTDGKEMANRRQYLQMTAGGLLGTSMLSTVAATSGDSTAETVDLGVQGLQSGDIIDGYLKEHLNSGTAVHIPAGTYQWRGTGLSGEYHDAALIGDGDVTLQFSEEYWNADMFAVDGGDFTLRNITIRGALQSDGNKSRLRFDARDANSTVRLDNFNLPDGDVGPGRSIGIYVGTENAGTIHLTDCHVEGFPNNGLYAGQSGMASGGGGRVVVDHCFFKNNNIDAVRLGGDGDIIRDSVIVQEEVPKSYKGGETGRGIRVRYPGEDIRIENVHITSDTNYPFIVPDRSDGPSGKVNGLYIDNNTSKPAAIVEEGSFTADTLHISGDDNLDVSGFDSVSNAYSGSDADPVATSLAELDEWIEGSSESGDGDETTSSPERTITVEGSTSDAKTYQFEVTGDIEATESIGSTDTINGSSADGTMYSGSDQYLFSGEVTSFTSEFLDELSVFIDGQEIDPQTINRTRKDLTIEGVNSEPKAYYVAASEELQPGENINQDDCISENSADGVVRENSDTYQFYGELTALRVASPENVRVTVNGAEVMPSEVGSDPLPNRLVIDGTTTDGEATYSLSVSEDIERSPELGGLECSDTVADGSISGTIGNDTDGYRFSGNVETVSVDGPATLTIEQTPDS